MEKQPASKQQQPPQNALAQAQPRSIDNPKLEQKSPAQQTNKSQAEEEKKEEEDGEEQGH